MIFETRYGRVLFCLIFFSFSLIVSCCAASSCWIRPSSLRIIRTLKINIDAIADLLNMILASYSIFCCVALVFFCMSSTPWNSIDISALDVRPTFPSELTHYYLTLAWVWQVLGVGEFTASQICDAVSRLEPSTPRKASEHPNHSPTGLLPYSIC